MLIGVIADTHIPDREKQLPSAVLDLFSRVSLVLHAGDFTTEETWAAIKNQTQLRAVRGNMDQPELKQKLPPKEVFSIEGVKIGLIHGTGSPLGIVQRVRAAFAGEGVNLVVYGHTHQPQKEWVEGVLFLNPGSPTDKVFAPFNSFAIVELQEGQIIKAEIIPLK